MDKLLDQKTGLHVWRWDGADAPGFLCLHSMGWNGLQWAPAAAHLNGRRSLLAPDLPGFGHSRPVEPVGYEAYADLLAGWLRDSGAGPQILVGSSWGCWLAECLAARHPDLALGLVLTDGGFWNPPAWKPGAPAPTLPTFPDRKALLAHSRRECPYDHATWDGSLGPAIALRYRETEAGGYRLNFEPETLLGYMCAIATAPWQEWIPQVRCPMLVLACHGDYPPQARAQKQIGLDLIRQAQPGAIVEEYEDRHHLAQVQDSPWFADRLLAFAASLA